MISKIFGSLVNGKYEYNIDEKIKWIKRSNRGNWND